MNTRIKKRKANCRLGQIGSIDMLNNAEHRFKFEDAQVLATTSFYDARIYTEPFAIFKHEKIRNSNFISAKQHINN